MITIDEVNQHLAPISHILNPPAVLDYPPKTDLTGKLNDIFFATLHQQSLAVEQQIFDNEYFHNQSCNENIAQRIVAWNITPDMVSLQKHYVQHLFQIKETQIDVEAIAQLNRSKFKDRGLLEQLSEELIMAAEVGNIDKVEKLLNSHLVHPDVADCHGHTALIGATVSTV
jgi:hypothetical protein